MSPSTGYAPNGLCSRLSTRTPLLGFFAVRRIRSEGVHIPPKSHSRVKVRVQGLSPSSRFTPPSALRVYFTPQTPFGFTFRGFPPREAARARRPRPTVLPLLRWLRSRSLGRAGPPAHQPTTPRRGAGAFGRLHGFHPLESPYRRQIGLESSRQPSPSWFSSSPGFSPQRRCGGSSPSLLPGASSRPPLHPVARMVRRTAALRSIAHHRSSIASPEATVPS